MLSALFKYILAIIYLPFHWLTSGFARSTNRADSVVHLKIQFTEGPAYISNVGNLVEQTSEHFIAAYLLFLSQFFYCCEEKQIAPVAQTLAEHIENDGDPSITVDLLLRAIRETFSVDEEDAFEGIFGYPNSPPSLYLDGLAPTRPIAEYSFVTFKKESTWIIDLRLSYRLNIVLFPVTVGLLYLFTYLEIDDEKLELLNSCILEYLLTLDSNDFRSKSEGAWSSGANKIIAKNLGI